jgi:hypothetical protein
MKCLQLDRLPTSKWKLENERQRAQTGPRDRIASHALNTGERRLRRLQVLPILISKLARRRRDRSVRAGVVS